ncbi:Jacalin-like lectin domain superfamily [Arabidopsis suecica]|uniref:Jacalin-like lectin domain superfamily n=1 Tax=Arabidopsis suecica TaxID=45249 RepID=A0A8T2FKX8_ARASU|nr:Jacalin-like lectin domain superfamily [Arabidopsis suecica]
MAAATMSWDDGKHMKVKRVQITYEDVINSIEAEYDGDTHNPHHHGTPGKKSDGVSLSPDEYITDVTGYYKTTGAEDAIAALAFKTNKTEYGPYGNKTRNQFSIHAPKDNQIAGFQGISSNVLNSIDVHFAPLPSSSSSSSSLSQANKVDAQGGKGGTSWDDGAHDHVRRVYIGQGDSGVTYVKFEYEKDSKKESREHGKKTLLGAEVFEVDPDDYITSVEVQSDRIFGQDTEVITSLIFKTSKGKISPPFGLEGSQKYELKDKNGGKLVGFNGRVGGELLNALGAYFAPSSGRGTPSATQPAGSAQPTGSAGAKKLEAKGGNVGNPWDDGPHDGVRKVYIGQGDSGVSYVKFVYDKDSKEVPGNDHGKRTLLAPEEFVLEYPNEYITSVELNYDKIFGTEGEIITMLRFTTNKRTSPPFGLEGAKSVLLKEAGHKIVGFHGKAGADIIHQVGVHVKPISK